MTMDQQCFKQMMKAIGNWSTADVRVVPGVMYQVRCGTDENDPNIEYQINLFQDCSETYVHNHGHSFVTLCLEGEYLEKIWKIVDDGSDAVTYQFSRKPGNIFDVPKQISGVLRQVNSRRHFPGNEMYVGTEHYHSIIPSSSDSRVLTFLRKQKHSSMPDVYVLSSLPTIDAPSDEIRPATHEERQNMYNKLQHILATRFRIEYDCSGKRSVHLVTPTSNTSLVV